MKKAVITMLVLVAAALAAQENQQGNNENHPRPGMMMKVPESGFRMPPGPWWKDSEVVQKINLRDDQAQQIEAIFQKNRDKLELSGRAVYQAEQALKPLIDSDQVNDPQVSAQINNQLKAVVQARTDLELEHAQMLLEIRQVLSLDQWKALQSVDPMRGFGGERRRRSATPPPPEL
ncbi:MAG TPA: hypothetical protein VE998_08315 [Terriglobales bacterium]|nr:hypothetical protein [Terriglobales bacterium]